MSKNFFTKNDVLNALGGLDYTFNNGRLELFSTKTGEIVTINQSQYYPRNKQYWFGITPENISKISKSNIDYFIFVLGFDAILKIPTKWIIDNVPGFHTSFKKDLVTVRHYHLQITLSENKAAAMDSGIPYDVTEYLLFISNASENESLKIQKEMSKLSLDDITREAKSFRNTGPQSKTVSGSYKQRIDNERQKARIKLLENYTCQICGFRYEYKNVSGDTLYVIEADHINEKSKGGDESIGNILILCPTCHSKKTRGIITVDSKRHIIYEKNKPISIYQDNHLGWKY